MNRIKLKAIGDELEAQFEGYKMFYSRKTGEIITVSIEDLGIAEESEEYDDFSEYDEDEKENIREALDIVVNYKDYVELPDKDDINEYDIMEEFAEDNDKLSRAMQGRGAFRRFKDEIVEQGIDDDWYSFKGKALLEIAREWCEDNGIAYDE